MISIPIAKRYLPPTMNSYRQNRQSKGRGTLVLATLAVAFLFGIDAISGGSVRTLVRSLGSSVWSAGSQAASAIGGSGFAQSRQALIKENETLKEEVARLTLRIAELGTLESENKGLRAVAHVAESVPGIT